MFSRWKISDECSSFLLICLSARTTTPKEFLLLFSQPTHAQEALKSTLKLQNVSFRITLFCLVGFAERVTMEFGLEPVA